MRTIEMNEKGIVVKGGYISFLDNVDACKQDAISRIRLVQGEDFYDQSKGIPWFDESLAKSEPKEITLTRIREALRDSEEVFSVQRLDFNYENNTATLSAALSSIYGVFEL